MVSSHGGGRVKQLILPEVQGHFTFKMILEVSRSYMKNKDTSGEERS